MILWDGSRAGAVYYGFEGALGSTFKAYKAEYSGAFLYQLLKRSEDHITQSFRTPNIPHVVKDFLDIFVIMSPLPEEQLLIGEFLTSFDEYLADEQAYLNQLASMKQSLLQKLFV